MNMIITSHEFEQLLEQHKTLLKKQQQELRRLPEGSISVRMEKGRINYCQSIDGVKKGITKNEKLVCDLARKKYLSISNELLESNIKHLKTFVQNYRSIDVENIIKTLPKNLRQLPEDIYIPYNRKKNKWMAQPFKQSDHKPEEKVHVTSRDLWVRSKSEVIIAEKLDAYNIPYRYEQVLYIDRYDFAPDFTILTKDGIKYWEHCGKVNDRGYIRKHNWKISMYERAGIVPWKNLIVTYDMISDDNEVGKIDSRIIEAEIISKLM